MLGLLDDARATVLQVLQRSPLSTDDAVSATLTLGALAQQTGQLVEAFEAYVCRSCTPALLRAATDSRSASRPRVCVIIRYEGVLSLVPDEPRALNNIGALLQLQKRHSLATKYLRR